jgi:hypothetical protein
MSNKASQSAKARCTPEWRAATAERLRTKIDDAKLISLYASGQEECGIALQVSRKVIYNAMKRLGIAARKAAKRDQWGPKNTGWKGADANIVCKHKRLYRSLGQPLQCDECGTNDPKRTYDWANLTGNYDDPSDFKRMCRSCHAKYDGKIQNLGAWAK